MTDLLHSVGLGDNPIFSGGLVLMAIGAAATWLRRIPGIGLAAIRRKVVTSVEIHDWDPAFGWAIRWLSDRDVLSASRDLTASSLPHSGPSSCIPEVSGISASVNKIRLIPAPGIHFTRYHGIPMLVAHTRERSWLNTGSVYRETLRFTFFGARRSVAESLAEEIQAYSDKHDEVHATRILVPCGDRWGEGGFHPVRPKESLSLAGDVLNGVLADLWGFLGSSRWYTERGVPYRRGYMLYGPPGTGKTTTVGVLAAELGFGIASLSLSDGDLSDRCLTSLLRNLPPKTILLIEDADCAAKSRVKENSRVDSSEITMTSLLNAIDGIGSTEGRILFLTTNHPDRLDPALVRPGRIDYRIGLDHATPDQSKQMFIWFFRGAADASCVESMANDFAAMIPGGTSPAEIQEHFLRHRFDPDGAVFWPKTEEASPIPVGT